MEKTESGIIFIFLAELVFKIAYINQKIYKRLKIALDDTMLIKGAVTFIF